ncbi:hypothetical protein BGZ72_002127 [Mortierella alpina]|nr:hypothetical protein BGZ72_002127 [Mortierella alpina]
MALPTEHILPPDKLELQIVSSRPGIALCIDNINGTQTDGNPVRVQECNLGREEEQKWVFDYNDVDIQLPYSGSEEDAPFCLDFQTNLDTGERNAVVNSCDGSPSQTWHPVDKGGEYFTIESEDSSTCLELGAATHNDDFSLIASRCNDQTNQLWSYDEM